MKVEQPQPVLKKILKGFAILFFSLSLGFCIRSYLMHRYSLDLALFSDYIACCLPANVVILLINHFSEYLCYMNAANPGGGGANQAPNQIGAGVNLPLPAAAGAQGAFTEQLTTGGALFSVSDPAGTARGGFHRGSLNTYQPYARNLAITLQHMYDTRADRHMSFRGLSATDLNFVHEVTTYYNKKHNSAPLRNILREMR